MRNVIFRQSSHSDVLLTPTVFSFQIKMARVKISSIAPEDTSIALLKNR